MSGDRFPRPGSLPPALRKQIQKVLDRLAEEHGLDLPGIDELLADGSLQIKISSDPQAAAAELGIDPDMLQLEPGQLGGKIEQAPGFFKAAFVGHVDDLGAEAAELDALAKPLPDPRGEAVRVRRSGYQRARPSLN